MRYALIALAGITMAACDKKHETLTPETPLRQVSQAEPMKPATPAIPPAPDKDRLPAEAERKAPVDRSATIKETLALMEKGQLGQAMRYLDGDVSWTEVGLPEGTLSSADEVIAYQNKSRTGFSDIKMRPKRIIESADYQVVEYVWSALHSGAFSDGTAATEKVATVPGAMLIRYGSDGLIDDVWNFLDWPSVLQQLGLAPDLPSDFTPAMLPESLEVIGATPGETGEATMRAHYLAFADALGPDRFKTTLNELATPDFAWLDLRSGRLVTDHDGSNTYFADRRGAFVRESSEIQTTVTAGAYFAAFVTNKLIYKGGYLGVPADGQTMTTHTLDIVQFDAAAARFKTLASYGNSYEILAALGMTAGAATTPSPTMGNVMIKACDDYVKDMRECMKTFDPATRETTGSALDEQITAWTGDNANGVKIDVIRQACRAATDAATRAYASSCPRVEWD